MASLSVRVDERLEEIRSELLRSAGIVVSESEYLRGLIVLHAILAGADLRGVSLPGWLSATFPQFFGHDTAGRFAQAVVVPFTDRVSRETQLALYQGLHMIFSGGPSPIIERINELITRYGAEQSGGEAHRRKK